VEEGEGGSRVEEAQLGAVEERGEPGSGGVEVLVVSKDELGEGWGFEVVDGASAGLRVD